MHKTRINLANPQELLELPGIRQAEADAIIRHRAQHGPISDAAELTQIRQPLVDLKNRCGIITAPDEAQ